MKRLIFSSLIAMFLLGFCLDNANAQEEDKVYSFVSLENPPTYPGGIAHFYQFIGENMKYPSEAVAHNAQGLVHLSFVVEKDGSVTDVKVEKKLGFGTDEEAVRVLKLGQKWNPGLVNGAPVRVKYNIPIKFALKGKTPSTTPTDVANTNTKANPSTQNDEAVYSFVALEYPPAYPGGIVNFYKFLGQNISYPKEAMDKKIQGNVHVSFTIEKDGSLSDIKVIRSLGYGTDEEAIRVIKLAKKWNPGMQNGKPVRVKYNIPVKFSLTR